MPPPKRSVRKSRKATEAKAQKRDAKVKRQETIEDWKKRLDELRKHEKNLINHKGREQSDDVHQHGNRPNRELEHLVHSVVKLLGTI